jgi:hypothetical protein
MSADVTLYGYTGGSVFALSLWNAGNDVWQFGVDVTGHLSVTYYNGTFFGGGSTLSTGTIPAGAKTHISARWNGSTITSCLAGVCTSAAAVFAPAASYGVYLGFDRFNNGAQLNGNISNLCIAKTALGCQ